MISYKVVARKNPVTKETLYHASANINTSLSLADLADNISRQCTVTLHDTKAVLSALDEQITLAILQGNSVRLGDLGSFHATLRSRGAETAGQFSTSDIRSVQVRFIRSRKMFAQMALSSDKLRFKNLTPAAPAAGA